MVSFDRLLEKEQEVLEKAKDFTSLKTCEAAKQFATEEELQITGYNAFTGNWVLTDGEEYSTELITSKLDK